MGKMLAFLFSALCCGLFCTVSIFTPATACSPSDLAALRSVAAAFPTGDFSDWEASDDCCAWDCVTCTYATPSNNSSAGGLVVTELTLDADERNLSNHPIPISLCRLSSLTSLSLSGGFSGSIPLCIGENLTSLVELDMSFNILTGHIHDSFSRLRYLQTLDLSYNAFFGPIPSFNSPLLQELNLAGNSFSGSIPSFNSPLLQELNLARNSFSGSIPLCICANLTSLVKLDISRNSLTGHIPHSCSRLGSLQTLDLSNNAFFGPIPPFNSPLLQHLYLAGNSFSGVTTSFFGPRSTLTSLSGLQLSFNHLSGEIPIFDPSRFPSLASLELDHNLFNGSFPESICGLANLTDLDLSSNAFSGQLVLSGRCRKPRFTTGLTTLNVAHNQFMGPFPEWIGSLSNLRELDLSYNRFNGILPNTWQNLSSLWFVDLSGNSLVAASPSAPKLPSWFFALPAVSSVSLSSMGLQHVDLDCSNRSFHDLSMDLSYNNFTSDVFLCFSDSNTLSSVNLSRNPLALDLDNPDTVKLIPPHHFYSLDMSSCKLRGQLTSLFFNRIINVMFLYLAHNQLVGQVPAQLGNLSDLKVLDLSHNNFTGFAPLVQKLNSISVLLLSNNSLVGDLSSLLLDILNISNPQLVITSLDVSHNSLRGVIPSFLGKCSPYILKLNDNDLEGSIPSELFTSVDGVKILYLSNNHLSGSLPSSLKNQTSLVLLDLSHNMLEGNLDSCSLFANVSSSQYLGLRILLLSYNNFSGSVPTSLGAIMPSLQLIDFSNNHLTGPIPVHTLQSLSTFRSVNKVSNAKLSASWDYDFHMIDELFVDEGTLHEELNELKVNGGTLFEELRINVKGNELTYQYVSQALSSLDLSGNNLSGPISIGLGELSGLVYLNLSRNRFSGSIPSDLGNLSTQLESLDMSFNELSGPIPTSFHDLTSLEVFNVSHNPGLSGPIPLNQPQFENPDSYIGDPNLCGDPTLHPCSAANVPTSTHSNRGPLDKKSNGFTNWIDEWIAIPGLCLGFVVGFLGAVYAFARF